MSTNLPLAISLNIIGNLISAIGWVLEKRQHQTQEQKEKHMNLAHVQQTPKLKKQQPSDISLVVMKSIFEESNAESQETNQTIGALKESNLNYCKSYEWWIGFIIFGAGSVLAAMSLGYGPATLLVPLESIIIVFNMILGWKFLNEQMYIKDYIGTVLIIIGITVIAIVGPQRESDISYSIEELRILFHNEEFYIFIICYTLFVLFSYILLKIPNIDKYIKNDMIFMLGFVNIAVYFGVWNTSLTKKCVEILSNSFNEKGINNWSHWLTYLFIISFILSTILLEYWRQKALALYVSTYVVATYRVLWIFGGILFGAFYWKEFDDLSQSKIGIFVLALFIMFAGIAFIAKKPNVNTNIQTHETEQADELPNIN